VRLLMSLSASFRYKGLPISLTFQQTCCIITAQIRLNLPQIGEDGLFASVSSLVSFDHSLISAFS